MFKRSARILPCEAALAGALLFPAAAHANVGPEIEPPRGYVAMCSEAPDICASFAPASVKPFTVAMALPIASLSFQLSLPHPPSAPPSLALVRQVNSWVNHGVIQQSDSLTYGVQEKWARSGVGIGSRGDCEDLAIEKRLRLIEAGVAPERLRFAIVYSRRAGLHVLLLVETSLGPVALDSRRNRIIPASKAGYRWITIQDAQVPAIWRKPLQ
jgi:predicted transglutaminase-like cysteine proteinase